MLTCGEPLPSKGTISNFGSVGVAVELSWATTSRSWLSEPWPVKAKAPDNTSMKAILTVSAAVAAPHAANAAAQINDLTGRMKPKRCMRVSMG